jgi:hypothetical protein
MNYALFASFLALVLAGALMISSGVTQLSNDCPSKSSSTTASTANPVNPTNINSLLTQSSSPQLSPSQAT